jgi:tetratricopeptide (TPR) repeat protein
MFLFKKTTPEKTSAKVQVHLLQANYSCEQNGHQDTTRKHYCKALCTLYYLNLSKRDSLDVAFTYCKALCTLCYLNISKRDSLDVAFIHTDIIRILKEEKKWDSALQHLMAEHGRDLEAASCCNEIGLIYQITGDVGRALKYYRQMVACEENEIPGTVAIATSYVTVGQICLQQSNHYDAFFEFRRALKIQERDDPLSFDTATTYANIALLHKDLGNVKAAAKYRSRVVHIDAAEAPLR